MGVDYFSCPVCGECFSDHGYHYTCAECESYLCQFCGEVSKERYGTIGPDHENAVMFGENALNNCDYCANLDTLSAAFQKITEGKNILVNNNFDKEFIAQLNKVMKKIKDEM